MSKSVPTLAVHVTGTGVTISSTFVSSVEDAQLLRAALDEWLASREKPSKWTKLRKDNGRRTDEIKRIAIKEFHDLGFLQEINRVVLHPAGLALEITLDDGTEFFGGVWDYRDDPEGIIYTTAPDKAKIESVRREVDRHRAARIKLLGSVVQE